MLNDIVTLKFGSLPHIGYNYLVANLILSLCWKQSVVNIAIKGMGHVLVEQLTHMDFCTAVFKLSLSFIFIFILQNLNMNYRLIKADFAISQPPVPSQQLLIL